MIRSIRVQEDDHVLVPEGRDAIATAEDHIEARQAGASVPPSPFVHDERSARACDVGRAVRGSVVDDHDDAGEIAWNRREHERQGLLFVERGDDDDDLRRAHLSVLEASPARPARASGGSSLREPR
jgi:hypothetical protein